MTHVTWAATRLASLLGEGDVVYVADDDQHADAIAAALAALCPANPVLYLPSSDALPGDVAPASPANIGARVAALRALHRARNDDGHSSLALILSGEAAAHRYPEPEAFALAPPKLAAGDPIESEQFAAMLEEIGYFADDRVDEPGEMAIRGDVIDIFPADAGRPARIDISGGVIAAIRSYNPLTQLTVTELDCLEIGRASEPAREGGTPILTHLAPGTIVFSEKAERRRQRYLQLARDVGKGGEAPAARSTRPNGPRPSSPGASSIWARRPRSRLALRKCVRRLLRSRSSRGRSWIRATASFWPGVRGTCVSCAVKWPSGSAVNSRQWHLGMR